MIVYKLLKLKNNKLFPLFINKNEETIIGQWHDAKCYPTKGFSIRKGWHCCLKPYAPHLKLQLKSGEKRVWVECEAEDIEYYNRPEAQGGTWVLAQKLKPLGILTTTYGVV